MEVSHYMQGEYLTCLLVTRSGYSYLPFQSIATTIKGKVVRVTVPMLATDS